MRVAFGLAGLLVALGVIVMIMSKYLDHSKGALDVEKKAKEQVQQIGGRSEDNTPAIQSFSVDGELSNGKLDSLIVTSVVSGGAMDRFYGLKKGDTIVEIGQAGSLMRVRDLPSADVETAKAMIVDAFQKSQQLRVVRDEIPITLPQGNANAGQVKPKDSIQSQLDAIQKIPTH